MAVHPQGQVDFLFYSLVLAIICICIAKNYKAKRNKTAGTYPRLPEPPGVWPLVGHVRLVGTEQLLHRTLGAMADNYGPAFGIRLGANKVLVVSDSNVAKECFTVNDKTFSSRPMPLPAKLAGYDRSSLVFAPYGPYWRELRKISASQLLSAHRLDLSKSVRDTEIDLLLDTLRKKCLENDGGSAVADMKEAFGYLGMNIVLRSVAGKGFEDDERGLKMCREAMAELSRLLGIFFFSDASPMLGWLDHVSGWVGEIKKMGKQIDCILENWVNEHREEKKKIDEEESNEKDRDFIDVLLSNFGDYKPVQEADTIIKAAALSLIAAGSDTTSVTLTWGLSLLLNHRHVLKRAQEELDTQVGPYRKVEESDVNNLRYLKAIVKETLRLYPPAPLSVPRISMEDCSIAGFHIPKGTQLLLNIWKVHRDPRHWTNPEEFVPERFLSRENREGIDDLEDRGKDFEYLPFGAGRRMCPGNVFATQVLNLALARLLHAFEVRTVSDKLPVDMSEGTGLSLPKMTPLRVAFTPRPAAAFYALKD